MRKILPFEKVLYLTKIDRKIDGDTIKRQNQVIENKTKCSNSKQRECKCQKVPSCRFSKHFFCNLKRASCHQQFRTCSTKKDCNSRACASNYKTIIYKSHSKCTISRKTSLLHTSVGKNWSGSRNTIYCKGVWNPVRKSPISRENTKLNKYVKRTILISRTGSFRNVGEKSFPKSRTYTRAIPE